MKIQIIEDNEDIREIYKDLFANAGHEVLVSQNGLNGVVDAVDFQPDVVLLDLMMPEMDGNEFLKALSDNTSISPYVIAVSNVTQRADIDIAKANGAQAFLRKSDYVGDALLKEVERLYTNRLGVAR